MHIFITGGAGFIGSQLVEYHILAGDKIHVVDNLSTGSKKNILPFLDHPDFRFSEADILTWPDLGIAVAWADRIYHMAALVGVFKVLKDPIKVLSTNIAGTERLLRSAQMGNWNPQIIIASTSEVYGHGLHCKHFCEYRDDLNLERADIDARRPYPVAAFNEDMEPMVGSSAVSRWNYSISKLADEAFGLSYARSFGMNITVVRLFNTIGPGQTGRYGMVVPRFVEQAVNGGPITVYGDGLQTRSFCDVRDTVKSLDLLADNPASVGEIVNVGNDREISIKGLAELIKERSRSDSPIIYTPYREAYGEDFEEVYNRKPNLDKFFKLTKFKHLWTLEETIDDLIARARQTPEKTD
jgi:UDP-glucose 4-epimerase